MAETHTGIRELHDDYAEQVNLAVAEGRDDLIDTLAARFAAAARRQHSAHGATSRRE